jgi:hypothetical protein
MPEPNHPIDQCEVSSAVPLNSESKMRLLHDPAVGPTGWMLLTLLGAVVVEVVVVVLLRPKIILDAATLVLRVALEALAPSAAVRALCVRDDDGIPTVVDVPTTVEGAVDVVLEITRPVEVVAEPDDDAGTAASRTPSPARAATKVSARTPVCRAPGPGRRCGVRWCLAPPTGSSLSADHRLS